MVRYITCEECNFRGSVDPYTHRSQVEYCPGCGTELYDG